MSKMGKILCLLMGILLLGSVTVWAGGGGDKSGGSTVTTLPPGAKSLDKFTINYYDFNDDPAAMSSREKAFYANVEKLYKSLYPNATFNLTGISAGLDGLDVLQMQLSSGTGPDVFEFQDRIVQFATAGFLHDLSDQPWTKELIDIALYGVSYNGKVYAAPNKAVGWGVQYDKKIYEDELGLRVPRNFQEFLDNCEKIKRAGYAPLVIGGGDGWPFYGIFNSFHSFLFGANKNFHADLYNGKASLTGKEMNDMFAAIKTLYDKGYFSEASMSLPWGGALQFYADGKAAMTFLPGPMDLSDFGYKRDAGFFYIPDWNGYNCLSVNPADTSYAVSARYKNASTYGADLISCLVDVSSLHIKNDDVGPASYKNKPMNFNNMAGKMYQEAFNRGPVVMQINLWIPASANLGMEIISSIMSGNGFSQQMLNDMQRNYTADRNQINSNLFR